jgi:putative ABC transport system permease protein
MLIGETVRVAFGSIRANKLRAALTMLGVIIGVAAVITVVAMGSGAQKAVQDRINALGANLITVQGTRGGFRGVGSSTRNPLTIADADSLRQDVTTVTAVVPEAQGNKQVVYSNQNINTSILGTTPGYVAAHNYTIVYGRNFTEGDDASRKRYAVFGADVPTLLNANPQALIGQSVAIGGVPFEIIGVLSKKGSSGFDNPDEQILIPINTARYRVFGNDRLRTISLVLADKIPMERAMVDVERVMRREHRIRVGAENDFQVQTPTDFLATQQETAQTFSTLLLSIAIVSLIVGGIGIMNIMLVSVTERTKEIGIRKALGATKFTIMSQFLIEALVLCVTGGLIGIGLGVGASVFVSKQYGSAMSIQPAAIVVAFAFSGLVGLFFGLWPARRAAGLDPIQALRYE